MSVLARMPAQQRMQLAFGANPHVGWLTLDVDGTIVDWSAGAQALLGWRADEVVGQPAGAVFAGQSSDGASAAAPALRWRCRKDGSRVLVEETTTPLRLADGTLAGWSTWFHDATPPAGARDAQLRDRVAELARANTCQNEFLATLAHELRNPLAPIRTSLDIMRLPTTTRETAAKARDTIGRQLDHLVHLVDDLLDLARVAAGKLALKKAPVRLDDVVLRAVEATLPLMEARRHRLHRAFSCDPVWLDADAGRLVQVLGNLLANAAKYTPEQGAIDVYAGHEGDRAIVRISDNGIGIPAALQPGLFDMFSQAHAGDALAHGGLGIGLHLVKRLTAMHGGTVTVSSAGAGCGSTFVLMLPIHAGGADHGRDIQEAERPATAACPRPLRILVVDDNVDAADMLEQILQIEGHEAALAYGARDGLALARRFRPDVALLDIGMQGMNGLELARAIRREPALAGTRLIALTGWATEQDRREARAAGFDAHLTKPVGIEMLRAHLAAAAKPGPLP